MPQQRSIIAGSERAAPRGKRVGEADADATVQVSVYMRPAGPPDLHPSQPGAGHRFPSRAQLHAERTKSLDSAMGRLQAFAREAGLKVVEANPGRRLVKLEGPVHALQSAFSTQLHDYEDEGQVFRGRTGTLSAPADVADTVEAVLGLDTRPIATPKSIRLAHAAASAGFLPNQVAELYGFPAPAGAGRGECIAIIELGGGFSTADTTAAFGAMKLTPPQVVAVPVSGGVNQPGEDTDADGEVALDIQVAGGTAPGAKLAVYFAPNTDQGFVDAISQAAHDQTNAPSVMSISWGSAESAWTGQAVAAMTSALQDAATLGVTVLAASGDGLATDGVSDGKAHVDFPASSPLAVGCGGTLLKASGGKISHETVWNSDGGGTGGGISDLFDVPAYQAQVTLPPSVNGGRKGRGVPDVASDADPNSGYRVVVDGKSEVIGGTSAAAPLWSGLFALVNESAGAPSGQPHITLYAHPQALRDTTQGDNLSGGIGYKATKGWDACTGLGSPKGAAIAALFQAEKGSG